MSTVSKTYIRKIREGWRVVHTSKDTHNEATTIVAPLSKEDALIVRDTFKNTPEPVYTEEQAMYEQMTPEEQQAFHAQLLSNFYGVNSYVESQAAKFVRE